jgi:hypothetical protein
MRTGLNRSARSFTNSNRPNRTEGEQHKFGPNRPATAPEPDRKPLPSAVRPRLPGLVFPPLHSPQFFFGPKKLFITKTPASGLPLCLFPPAPSAPLSAPVRNPRLRRPKPRGGALWPHPPCPLAPKTSPPADPTPPTSPATSGTSLPSPRRRPAAARYTSTATPTTSSRARSAAAGGSRPSSSSVTMWRCSRWTAGASWMGSRACRSRCQHPGSPGRRSAGCSCSRNSSSQWCRPGRHLALYWPRSPASSASPSSPSPTSPLGMRKTTCSIVSSCRPDV